MHELPVVEDLIKTLDRESEEKNITGIKAVNLRIGELSGIMGECVQMYFDVLSRGHSCERAVLNITHVPAMLKCDKCGREFPHEKSFDCPDCGRMGKLVKGSGREFMLESIDV